MTRHELKEEILNGPLRDDCAAYWATVFDDAARPDITPEMLAKLSDRQGLLTPDAAYEINRVLSDPTRRPLLVTQVSRGAFIAAVAPLSVAVAQLPDVKQRYWTLILTLLTGGDDTIDVSRVQIASIMAAAIADGILTEQQRDEILGMGGHATQSRFAELGWSVSLEDIQEARKL